MADYFATMRASENGLASLRHLDETRLFAPCAPCAPHRPAGLPETGGGLRRLAPAPARGARKLRQALLEDLARRIGQARRCNAALCDQLQTGPAG